MTNQHPAFPINGGPGIYNQYEGLTKRELIAAMCLQGLLSDPGLSGSEATFAGYAINYADALLAALEETARPPKKRYPLANTGPR